MRIENKNYIGMVHVHVHIQLQFYLNLSKKLQSTLLHGDGELFKTDTYLSKVDTIGKN